MSRFDTILKRHYTPSPFRGQRITPYSEAVEPEKQFSPSDGLNSLISLNSSPKVEKLPFLDSDGTLIIPSNASARYQWWKEEQTIRETLKELGASSEIVAHYVNREGLLIEAFSIDEVS